MDSASHLSPEYKAYLESEDWQVLRAKALLNAGYRCQVCNTRDCLDVHHRTYERFRKEEVGDLTVLCRSCHALFHEAKRSRPRPKEKPPQRKKPKPKRRQPKGWRQSKKKAWKPARDRSIKPLTAESVSAWNKSLRQERKRESEARREPELKPWDTTSVRMRSGKKRAA